MFFFSFSFSKRKMTYSQKIFIPKLISGILYSKHLFLHFIFTTNWFLFDETFASLCLRLLAMLCSIDFNLFNIYINFQNQSDNTIFLMISGTKNKLNQLAGITYQRRIMFHRQKHLEMFEQSAQNVFSTIKQVPASWQRKRQENGNLDRR